jgi:hypothetical protein
MDNIIKLGDRKFQVIMNGTVLHDFWMHKKIKAAGLEQIVLAEGETTEVYVDRMLDHVIGNGHALVLLGGLLAPAELTLTEWTPAVAAECTKFLAQLMEPADKIIVRGLIAQALIGFFRSGLASFMTSRMSSSTSGTSAGASTMTAGV